MDILLIALLSFLSALVTSVFGFGAGLVLTPLLGLMMPLDQALAVASLVFLFTAGSKVYWYRHDIDRTVYWRGFLQAIPGLLIGCVAIRLAELAWLETVYGVLLLIFALNSLRAADKSKALMPRCLYPLFGGIVSIMMHAGGIFFLRFGQLYALDRVRLVGTVAAIHFSMNILKAGFFTGSGLVSVDYLYKLIPAYAVAVVGTRIGRDILKKYLDERSFTIGMSLLLVLLSLKYLF